MIDVDKTYHPKPFFCPGCGSAMGIIIRDVRRVTKLNVFRQVIRGNTIDLYLEIPDGGMILFGHALYSVLGLNDGDAVLCQYCGRESPWSASKQAVDEMLTRLRLSRK